MLWLILALIASEVAMLLIGAGLLALAVAVQRKLVDTDWDPAPGRQRPAAADAAPAVTGGRSYPKIAPPAGAPAPPPPPD